MLVAVPIAEAGPIVYFDSYRSLEVDGQLQENSTTGTWGAFIERNGPGIHNGHTLGTIGEKRFDAAGNPYDFIRPDARLLAYSLFDPNAAAADFMASFSTSFLLDSPYAIDFDIFLDTNGHGVAQGSLFAESTQTMLAGATATNAFRRLTYTGVLEPGIYTLAFLAQLSEPAGRHDGSADFFGEIELRPFTPVPEPATLSLFGIGLAAVWRQKRRLSTR